MKYRQKDNCQFKTLTILVFVILQSAICFARENPAERLLTDAMRQFAVTSDYTCILDKRVRKNGRLYEDVDIAVKFKKPNHYYFRWTRGLARGREVIFVEGKYDGKLVAHPGGPLRFVTLRLDPEGPRAMRENRHSLRESGLQKIMALMDANLTLAKARGLKTIQMDDTVRLEGHPVQVITARFPPHQGYYAHRIRIYLDTKLKLPRKVTIYDWSDTLVEEYVFRNLKVNVGLAGHDFDPANPAYQYVGRKR